MTEYYPLIKAIHIGAVFVTVSLFLTRGYIIFALQQAPHKLLRVLPHINDSILLGCAIFLVVLGNWPITQTPWLMAKIGLLLLYIGLGIVAFRGFLSRPLSILCFFLAVLSVATIILIALRKNLFFEGLIA